MEILAGQVVGPYLIFLTLSLIKYDVYEVLLPRQVICGGHHELLGLLLVVHFVVDTSS